MNQIKFSFDYEKLPEIWEDSMAVLVSVCNIDSQILDDNPSFLKYDTKHRGHNQFYEINFFDGILLLFYHPNSNSVFTTIRSFNPGKFQYYYDLIGKEFNLKRVNIAR